jgi:hypothetical protein
MTILASSSKTGQIETKKNKTSFFGEFVIYEVASIKRQRNFLKVLVLYVLLPGSLP